MDPCRTFRKLARNNMLANVRLHAACSKLQPGEFEAQQTGFFPSLKATLNHILVIDWFYVDALEGGTLGPAAWEDEEPYPEPSELAQAQRQVDMRLLKFCETLLPEGLARTIIVHRGARQQKERCDDILSHLFQHQTHHRGQAHAMLSGTSVPPPQLDEFIVADDADARQAEIALLGWSEDDLMK